MNESDNIESFYIRYAVSLAYSSRNKQIAILIAVSAIAAMLGVIALNMTALPNVANVQAIGIEIYWDSNYAKKVSLIEWGTLEPGAKKMRPYTS